MLISPESDLSASLRKLTAHGPLLSVVPVPGLGYAASKPGIAHLGAALSAEQAKVFDSVADGIDGDILVLAGPGSGKTKTLVASIAHAVAKGASPDSIVAISFTNNSAAELKVRLTKVAEQYSLPALNRVHISTFHAWVSQLEAKRVTPWKYPPIGLQTASFALALDLKNPDSASHTFSKTEVMASERHLEDCESFDAMEERKFNQIGEPDSTGDNRLAFNHLKTATAELESGMAEVQLASFGTIMKSGASRAAELKDGGVSWLFIDEAQDLNAPQADMVAALKTATGCRVFAIADDDQGIYKFRGASSQFLRGFESRSSTRNFQLTTNFRSTESIVQACVNWITPNWNKLGRTPKALTSIRKGLPVILLAAQKDKTRGKHAKIIVDACLKAGLLNTYGEVAALGYSPGNVAYDLKDAGLPIHSLADFLLDSVMLKAWLEVLKAETAPIDDWHHPLWKQFLDQIADEQNAAGETTFGHPGLNDLYASLEVIRRLNPELTPARFAGLLEKIAGGEKPVFTFTSGRPDPVYTGDKINYISFHSSKGMEFPVVWVTGGAFTLNVSIQDIEEGQPNVQGEHQLQEESTLDELNKLAASMERRRLLYVAMSRASDLLMISVAPTYGHMKEEARIAADYFRTEITKALHLGGYYEIANDNDAHQFAAIIRSDHRNRHWSPPHRYRVESYSSLTGQAMPGEVSEIEIPKEREFPVPQSPARVTGDLFHRVMHLLTLEPALIEQRLAGTIDNATLMARVSQLPPAELAALDALLNSYFGDSASKPWEILLSGTCRSEVPFSHVAQHPATGEEILIKGFIDLVAFRPDGSPCLILDYKIGPQPPVGSDLDNHHTSQLQAYRDALCSTYSVDPESIELVNYYVNSRLYAKRS